MSKSYNVAIVGATGLVGSTTLSILAERHFPIKKLYLLASERSAGEKRLFHNEAHVVEDIANFDFGQTDISFFCTANDISALYVPKAVANGNIVFDKSSYFRYNDDVPLIVPEVNQEAIQRYANKQIIANPNCSTIPIVVALKPLYDAVGLVRMNVATYQSVSGTGKEAMTELTDQTLQLLHGKAIHPTIYPQQIAFNLLPQIDGFEENGYTREEMKIVWETHKILNDTSIAINPTAVRVPVLIGHSAALHIETRDKITSQQAMDILRSAPGIELMMPYPTPAHDAAGKDSVYVGRVRADASHPRGLNLWVVTDNLRKGAALNAIQVAEKLLGTSLSR